MTYRCIESSSIEQKWKIFRDEAETDLLAIVTWPLEHNIGNIELIGETIPYLFTKPPSTVSAWIEEFERRNHLLELIDRQAVQNRLLDSLR